MPSLAALEAYNQYLTQYYKPASQSKQDLHDSKKLKEVYGSIQKKNSQAPIFLNAPSSDEVLSALVLKNDVYSYHQDIAKLYANNPADPFMQKFPYSSDEELASVSLSSTDSDTPLPSSVTINIEGYASGQTCISRFMKSQNKVSLPNGNYSFDLHLQKYGYELQFDIYPDDKNIDLQERISNLINKSDLGITAGVLKNKDSSALCIISNSIGKPVKGEYHFSISDENTSQTAGIVDYLGMNDKIIKPQNARISYEGQEYESYDNSFIIYDRYELKINRSDNIDKQPPVTVEIGFYPDTESLTKNIEGFTSGYNALRNDLISSDSTEVLRGLDSLLKSNSENLSYFGVGFDESGYLEFTPPKAWSDAEPEVADTKILTDLGNIILKKLEDVAVDPMVHINRKIGIYQNPSKKEQPIRPYLDYYGGLIFHKSV